MFDIGSLNTACSVRCAMFHRHFEPKNGVSYSVSVNAEPLIYYFILLCIEQFLAHFMSLTRVFVAIGRIYGKTYCLTRAIKLNFPFIFGVYMQLR